MSSVPADYDLNGVFDALAERFQGLPTGLELSGEPLLITAYSEVEGNVQVPAIVLELDDIGWDQTFGAGMDEFTIMMTILVQDVSTGDAQRILRSFLSRSPTSGLARIKAKLEEDASLGGLVSYVRMAGARQMGKIAYDGVDYMGIALPLEVTS